MEQSELEGLEALAEIGRGGFGVVYRAVETDLNRTVAVKVLNSASAEVLQRRLERERRAMGVLSGHPNIVTIHRTGTAAGSPYLVMEYLGGGSLADRLATVGPLGWHDAVQLGATIADAVEAAHRAGVLHRDIKPANILLSVSGVPKLGDFGIANVESVSQTSGVLKATVAHAPPEVLSGDEPDARSDVYSLASTIYELIAGTPAFVRPTDTSPVAVLMRITSEPVPELDPALAPLSVTRCLQQAMAKDRDHRPASAAEFGAQLLAAAGQPVGPPPAVPGPAGVSPLAATQVAPFPEAEAPSAPMAMAPGAAAPPHPPPQPAQFASAAAVPGPPPSVAQPYQHGGAGGMVEVATVPTPGAAPRIPIWLVLGVAAAAVVLAIAATVILTAGDDVAPVAAPGDTQQPDPEPLAGNGEQPTPTAGEASTSPSPSSSSTTEDTLPPVTIDLASTSARTAAVEQLVAGDLPATAGYDNLPDYAVYDSYGDEAEVITVSVPTDWGDRIDASEQGAYGIQVGTSIAGAFDGRAESGIGVFLYPPGFLPSSDLGDLLDLLLVSNEIDCVPEPAVDFDHRLFTGRYQVLRNCPDTDPELMSIQMVGVLKQDSGYTFQVTILAAAPEDIAASETVLDTLQIGLDRVGS